MTAQQLANRLAPILWPGRKAPRVSVGGDLSATTGRANVTQDIVNRANRGDPMARTIFLHELAGAMLTPKALARDVAQGEHQTSAFAGLVSRGLPGWFRFTVPGSVRAQDAPYVRRLGEQYLRAGQFGLSTAPGGSTGRTTALTGLMGLNPVTPAPVAQPVQRAGSMPLASPYFSSEQTLAQLLKRAALNG